MVAATGVDGDGGAEGVDGGDGAEGVDAGEEPPQTRSRMEHLPSRCLLLRGQNVCIYIVYADVNRTQL
jgi:hypothetical protein